MKTEPRHKGRAPSQDVSKSPAAAKKPPPKLPDRVAAEIVWAGPLSLTPNNETHVHLEPARAVTLVPAGGDIRSEVTALVRARIDRNSGEKRTPS